MSGELGDVLVVGAAALGLDDREESIVDVVDDDIGEPAVEVELVRDVVCRQGLRLTHFVGDGLGGEGAEYLVERCDELFWKMSAPDGLEQGERTNRRRQVFGPSSLCAVAVSHGLKHVRRISNKRSLSPSICSEPRELCPADLPRYVDLGAGSGRQLVHQGDPPP